jgi:hypothetical protein
MGGGRAPGDDPDRALVAALGRAADGAPGESVLTDLLAALGRSTGASYAGFWARTPGGSAERAAWPVSRRRRLPTDTVVAAPGGTADLGGPGWVVLALPGDGPPDPAGRLLLERAAAGIGLLAGAAQLEEELTRRSAHAAGLAAAVREAPGRLRAARAAEQRRGVTEVLGAITEPLAEIRRWARDCAAALPVDPAAARQVGGRLSAALEQLIDRFRVVVRGVHSTVLQRDGLATALAEYAADLPRPVRRAGDPPPDLRGPVAPVLYHAAVPVLRAMAAAGDGPLELTVGRGDGEVTVGVAGPVPAPTRLTAVLAAETAALTAVGGRLTGAVDATGCLRIEVSVPDGLRPAGTGPAPEPPAAPLLERVRALGTAAVAAYGSDPGAPALAAAAARLDEPVRVAVTGPPHAAAAVTAVLLALPGVTTGPGADVVVHVLRPGEMPPAATANGPYPLAVVDGPEPAGGPRLGVVAGVVGIRAAPSGDRLEAGRADLVGLMDVHVLARADALRARTSLRGLRRVLRRHPLPSGSADALLRELEKLDADAPELAELDALAALRTCGDDALPPGAAAEAARLLGAAGPSPQARLALAPGAGPAEVRVAATEHLARWAARAEHRTGGRTGHEVCRAAVRACERVLAGVRP